jgi:glycyl-tRNA synthetase beta chain
MPDFLLEIGCEEIPARMINDAEMTLQTRVANLFARARLWPQGEIDRANIETLSTPRRLAVILRDVLRLQPDTDEQIIGPPLKVAQKHGQPTAAGEAFSKKMGVAWKQLKVINSAKGEYVAADIVKKGRSTAEILRDELPNEIASIHWPKSMYWRQRGEFFVRPVRWLVAMLDDQVIPLEFLGVRAGQISRGHRILANREVRIQRAGEPYIQALREARVLGRAVRQQEIRKALDAATRAIPHARWREDKLLLETVVNLTEWPAVVLGNFDPEFLNLPEVVLVTVMRDHQKYFAVDAAGGKLLPHFLAVLNTNGDPENIIRHGHERVLRARFNDAHFFWQTDQKHSLRERVSWLKQVTFQKDLGSYYEKTRRLQRLCSWLAENIREQAMAIRPGIIHKAACLAKADLTTELVKEFTELQGIVGGLYARVQDLDRSMSEDARQAIATAIYDQYKPESMEDSVPRTIEGAVLSLSDKADTIAGMFALGLIPSGSKDPFALRRQANGIVRIIAEHKLPLGLSQIFLYARETYRDSRAEANFVAGFDCLGATREFFRERLDFHLREVLGYPYGVVNAVLAAGADDVVDLITRAQAVSEVMGMPEFQAIAAACKRMRNILKQARENNISPAHEFECLPDSAQEEKELAAFAERHAVQIEQHRQGKKYQDALLLLSAAREKIDGFFDKVMVMVEDERIRANRLALLEKLLKEFSTIADFSEIVTEGAKESSI